MESKPHFSPWIAGERRPGGAPRPLVNPHDGSEIGTWSPAQPADVEAALAAGARGARAMAKMPAHERHGILVKAARLLEERREEVARDLVREAGKPLRDALVEVDRCVVTLRTSGEEALRIEGEMLPLDATKTGVGRYAITRRFPLGLVTAISPFNFPLNLPAHKVGPALAAGNAMILKPAPRTPRSAFHLAGLLVEAGCPAEAIAVVPGDPPAIDPLIDDPRVAMVSFTGSAAVGWQIKARVPKKKVTLELGGNAAAIVHSDADKENALARCIAGSFTYAGQVCIRSQRLLLHESIARAFVSEFLARAKALKVGDPMEESTEMGPMIDAAAAARAWSWVREAVEGGAKRLLGSEPRGAHFDPAVLAEVPRDSKVACEEIFAPVVVIEGYSDIDDALETANASRYGLQAGIFTNDLSVLWRAYERLSVGAVIHNDVPMFRSDAMRYGGVKESGFGREGVRFAVEEMTEPRLLVLRPNPRP